MTNGQDILFAVFLVIAGSALLLVHPHGREGGIRLVPPPKHLEQIPDRPAVSRPVEKPSPSAKPRDEGESSSKDASPSNPSSKTFDSAQTPAPPDQKLLITPSMRPVILPKRKPLAKAVHPPSRLLPRSREVQKDDEAIKSSPRKKHSTAKVDCTPFGRDTERSKLLPPKQRRECAARTHHPAATGPRECLPPHCKRNFARRASPRVSPAPQGVVSGTVGGTTSATGGSLTGTVGGALHDTLGTVKDSIR